MEGIIFAEGNGSMDRVDRWKLADELNVYQISLLIAGYDPSEFEEVPSRIVLEFDDASRGSINLADQAARSRS